MTNEELRTLEITVELVNSFCALPEEHPADKADFVFLVHRIQDMIISRPIRRNFDLFGLSECREPRSWLPWARKQKHHDGD